MLQSRDEADQPLRVPAPLDEERQRELGELLLRIASGAVEPSAYERTRTWPPPLPERTALDVATPCWECQGEHLLSRYVPCPCCSRSACPVTVASGACRYCITLPCRGVHGPR